MGEALDYGYSLFETIRYQACEAQNLEAHYERLRGSAKALDIVFDKQYEVFEKEVLEAIRASNQQKGVIRYQLSKDGMKSLSQIQVKENRYVKSMYDRGFKLCVSDVVKSSGSFLIRHKSSNYLENLLVLKQAKAEDYDEALFLNEKSYITEGTYTNLFYIKENTVYTPELKCGLLKGTMRTQVIEVLEQNGVTLIEGAFPLKELQAADAVFVTNALMGVMPVHEIRDTKTYTVKHKIVDLLSDQLMADWFE